MCDNNQTKKVISVDIAKLSWPKEIDKCFPVELIQWLISEGLSPAVIEAAAKTARIRVTHKPRTKKEAYLVVGGICDFVLLVNAGWSEKVDCILDHSVKAHDVQRLLYMDVCNDLFRCKSGAVANTAKAVVLIELMKLRDQTGTPSYFNLVGRHLKGNNLLKQIAGYDSRAYQRADKKGMNQKLRAEIEAILDISSGNTSENEAEPENNAVSSS